MKTAPKMAEWLLRLTLPKGIVGESVLGDLCEDYAANRSVSRFWFWRQSIGLIWRYAADRVGRRLPARNTSDPQSGGPKDQGGNDRRARILPTVVQDLTFAIRQMLRSPTYTGIAVLTLALGIGANTALFSVINTVLIQPLPFEDSDRLVWMRERDLDNDQWSVAYPNFADWRRDNDVFEDMAAHRVSNMFLTGTDSPERLSVALVSAQLFPILHVEPAIGRAFTEGDDGPGASPTAVLGFDFWQRRYGGDPDLVGQTISLNDKSYIVIGIAPDGFLYPLTNPDVALYLPLGYHASEVGWIDRRSTRPGLSVTARMKPGVSLEQARANMDAVTAGIEQAFPDQNTGMSAAVTPLRQQLVGNMHSAFLVLLLAVALVLLIACANVANLLLARASARAREVAVRKSLGAGPVRLLRQLLTESVLLALIGGGAGILLAVWGVTLLPRFLPANLPILYRHIGVDGAVLGASLAISVITGVLFGLYPAIQMARQDVAGVLKEEGGTQSSGGNRVAFRNALAVVELSLAVVLLVSAGLVMRSFFTLTNSDPGFDQENLLVAQLSISTEGFDSRVEIISLYGRVEDAVTQIPGVESAGLGWPLLGGYQIAYVVEDRPLPGPGDRQMTDLLRVTADYFPTMKIPLIRGRYFSEADRFDTTPVAIVDEMFAEKHWPGEDPIGKRVKAANHPAATEPWLEVVGLVGHVKSYGVDRSSREELYLPFTQAPYDRVSFLVRTSPNNIVSASTIQTAVSGLVHDRPIYNFRTMKQHLGRRSSNRRISLVLISLFAGIALVMACAGVYGVVAYSVALRGQEYGIRMAMGASAGGIHRMVLFGSARLALIGVGLGLLAAYFTTALLSGMLFGINARDPLTFVGVGSTLTFVAVAASLVPAFRATRSGPLGALRGGKS